MKMEGYILIDKNNWPIALDSSSGGYPYRSLRIQDIHFWDQHDKAKDYNRMFPEYRVVKAKLELIWEEVKE